MALGVGLSFLSRDLPFRLQIAFVSDEHHDHFRGTVHLHFVQPHLNVLKARVIRDVVDQHDAVAALVVGAGNRLESSR